jgi:Concanavalin A-like lectin/glucanases superfamily
VGGSQGSGGQSGGRSGSSLGGSSGSGGTAGAGGATVDIYDSSAGGSPDDGSMETGSDLSDANVVDMDDGDAIDAQVDVNESRWKDWNAFWPLASGSTINGSPGTTPDVSGHGYDATYGGGISFAKSAMVMSGGYVSIPPQSSGPAVDVTGSYSVSVWVTMTNTTSYRTFVSADGNTVSEFYLQMREDNRFAFTLPTSDTGPGALLPPSGTVCVASATLIIPVVGTQYHLVGTRDATTGDDTLYVNGALAGTKNCPASNGVSGVGWPASTFGIGYGMWNSGKTDYFAGSISNVGLIGRVLTPDEVAALNALGPG